MWFSDRFETWLGLGVRYCAGSEDQPVECKDDASIPQKNLLRQIVFYAPDTNTLCARILLVIALTDV